MSSDLSKLLERGGMPRGTSMTFEDVSMRVEAYPGFHRMVLKVKDGGTLVLDIPSDMLMEAASYESPEAPDVRIGDTDWPVLSFFSLDFGPTVLGFSWCERWNGFGKPVLEESTLRRWVKETFEERRASDEGFYFEWRGDALWFVDPSDPGRSEEINPRVVQFAGVEYRAYDVSMALCWFEFSPDQARQMVGNEWRDCLTAITPPGLERMPAKMMAEPVMS